MECKFKLVQCQIKTQPSMKSSKRAEVIISNFLTMNLEIIKNNSATLSKIYNSINLFLQTSI